MLNHFINFAVINAEYDAGQRNTEQAVCESEGFTGLIADEIATECPIPISK
jgi:hypothetical protein